MQAPDLKDEAAQFFVGPEYSRLWPELRPVTDEVRAAIWRREADRLEVKEWPESGD